MARSSYELAEFGPRIVAAIIDGLVLAVIGGLLSSIAGNAGWGIGLLTQLAYQWYFLTRQDGQTPGKRLMNLKVIKVDGSALNDADAIIRTVGYYINSAILLIGWIIIFFDSNRQGLHDKLASTYVVKV
jgi:uncharacterized RDD family membrane protein YckC